MKSEPTRLEVLQRMDYTAYRQTPEWQQAEQAALKRAGHCCQVCRKSMNESTLSAYHANFDHIGCEQEGDVLVLCLTCYRLLSQQLSKARTSDSAPGEDMSSDMQVMPSLSLAQRALVFGPSALVGLGVPALLHAPPPAELFGLGLAIFLAVKSPKIYAEIRSSLPDPFVSYLDNQAERKRERAERGDWSVMDRLMGRHLQAPESEDLVEKEARMGREQQDESVENAPLFQARRVVETSTIERVSVPLICQHIERNSYGIYIGRSLTEPGNPALPINIYKQHIQIIGVSQHGKSSFAAALMEILTQTHNPEYLQLALLDMENLTSRLFANLPHVMTWRGTRLHARSIEEVIAHLEIILDIIASRYSLPAQERQTLPILLVYLEEFLALKNELKQRIALFKGKDLKAQQEEAIRQYAQLSTAFNTIALRGLKARVQFLLCAQVDYADNDFREGFAQFNIRLSFGVDPDAARAAGFKSNDLLAQNAKANAVGQAVIEAPGVKDLLLAPDYPLEERIIALETQTNRQGPASFAELPVRPTHPAQLSSAPEAVMAYQSTLRTLNRKQARLERLRGTAIVEAPVTREDQQETARTPLISLVPRTKVGPRRATIEDAITVWDSIDEPIGRPRLRKELEARGLECSDDLAKNLLGQIRERLAGGVAVGGGE